MDVALAADPDLADRFAADDLVASLLLVHGLHPHDVERRVSDALDSVRPYLGSHGGDVSLLGVDDDVVRLQFQGSCKSCPSSSVTLELAVEDAVRAAAPEISSIEVVAAEEDTELRGDTGGVTADPVAQQQPTEHRQLDGVAAGSGARRPGGRGGRRLPGRGHHGAGLPGGRRRSPTGTAAVSAATVTVPSCLGTLAGAQLRGAVLRCPGVRRRFRRRPRRCRCRRTTAIWSRYRCWCATACCRWPFPKRWRDGRQRQRHRRARPHPRQPRSAAARG